jgi:hypothetical protein
VLSFELRTAQPQANWKIPRLRRIQYLDRRRRKKHRGRDASGSRGAHAPMRIGLVSTVSAPVRCDSHGSVEAWTYLLARELRSLGYEVTVFGCAGSDVPGEVVVTLPLDRLRQLMHRPHRMLHLEVPNHCSDYCFCRR